MKSVCRKSVRLGTRATTPSATSRFNAYRTVRGASFVDSTISLLVIGPLVSMTLTIFEALGGSL